MKKIIALFLCVIILFSYGLSLSAIAEYRFVGTTSQTDIQPTDWFTGSVYSLRSNDRLSKWAAAGRPFAIIVLP